MHVWASIHEYPVRYKDGELPTDWTPSEIPVTFMSYRSNSLVALLEDVIPIIRLIALGVKSIHMMTHSNLIRLRYDFFLQDRRQFSEPLSIACISCLVLWKHAQYRALSYAQASFGSESSSLSLPRL